MEHLGSSDPVNIFCMLISCDQVLIPGHMCQHTQLNLRIVRIDKYIPFFWHKNLSDQTTKFHTDRDILQIRLCAADTPCCCNRLIKGTVDSSIRSNAQCQSIRISGF